MGTLTEPPGFLYPMKDHRGGKDRRKYIDPRYRNPAYSRFVDRRTVERRKPVYDEVHPFVKEHPLKRWTIVISILVAGFLAYVFLFSNLIASKRSSQERPRKGSIILGFQEKGGGDDLSHVSLRENEKA